MMAVAMMRNCLHVSTSKPFFLAPAGGATSSGCLPELVEFWRTVGVGGDTVDTSCHPSVETMLAYPAEKMAAWSWLFWTALEGGRGF